MNAMYKFAEQAFRENTNVPEKDEIMIFLQQSVIDGEEYLRYRISERFDMVMKSLFDAHKKDKLPPEQADMVSERKEQVQTYLDAQKTEPADKAKVILMCKQPGLNTAKLTDEE